MFSGAARDGLATRLCAGPLLGRGHRLRESVDAEKQKAREDLRRIQASFEKKVREAHAERLASFERAQKAGLSLREIAEEVGLHWTRVGQILRGE
jgi:hypothetical protein